MTPRQRSDEQVLTSATQLDAAMLAGAPADVLAELVAVRAHWHATGSLPGLTSRAWAALAAPAVARWDEVFVHAARKLSDPDRSVRS